MGRDTLMFTGRIAHLMSEDIVAGDDGFYVFWPTKNKGAYSSQNLRHMANLLDWLNQPWEKEIERYFKNE